jgi:hypothetical protein
MKTLVILTASLLSAPLLPAAILAQYDFEASGGALSDKAAAAGVTVSAITFGAKADTGDSLSANTSPTGGAQSLLISNAGLGNSAVSTSAATAEAISDGNFFQFTVTPQAGSPLNLTTLTFDKGRLAGNSNDLRILVTSSFDNSYNGRLPLTNAGLSLTNVLESNQGTEISAITVGSGQSWGSDPNVSVSLSGASFQNLTTPVTFRIFAFNLSSDVGSASNQLYFDNVTLNGSIVPEPSAALLGLLGIGTFMVKRRR